VAAPAAAPTIASAATAAFHPNPDRRGRDGAYSAPDQAGGCCDAWPDQAAGA
jgi:hypothetical protein